MTTRTEELVYDPYDYAIHDDPYPTYARMREEAPLYHSDLYGFWALSRHSDVAAGFKDGRRLSNRYGVSLDPASFGPEAHRAMSFLAMDPPDHTRMRALVSRGFTPKRVADLTARIERITMSHLEPALAGGRFDFVTDLAGLVPMDVISELLGVAPSDRAELRRLADLLVHRDAGVLDVPAAGIEAAILLAGYFSDLIAARRRAPTGDLTSALTVAEVDGDRLSDDEIISFLILMVVAGNETTTKLLANAWYWAARFRPVMDAVTEDPDRVPAWVEETLRYDTSTQMLVRVTHGPVELLGTVIPPDSPVLLLLGSANRDPAVFPDPDTYDIGRDASKLISFGAGRHFCLGASLARLEARTVLRLLAERCSGWEVDEAAAARVHSINVRGFAALPTTTEAK
ncbi:MAG TPA: cytochrome P450 [Acidimicrobiales bacterium]|nr:cytochrome P450 [Acidimicrobiales bacterium]